MSNPTVSDYKYNAWLAEAAYADFQKAMKLTIAANRDRRDESLASSDS